MTRRSRPDLANPTTWRTSLHSHPHSGPPPSPPKLVRARAARFVASVNSGYWKNGKPQQLQAFVQAQNRSVVLGLTKAERRVEGITATRQKRPHKYVQAAQAFLYNLSDKQEAGALVETMRHLTGFAAGLANTPFRAPFRMEFGERRLIHSNAVEQLEVVCENANFKIPDNRLFARDTKIRQAYWKRWRKDCAPVRKYRFVLTRTDKEKERRLVIYPEAVPQFNESLLRLVNSFWLYLQRHPEQVEKRYEGGAARWQLHYPTSIDWLATPVLREAIAFKAEGALFTHPELYEGDTGKGTDLYLKRLLAYAEGSLRWRDGWRVTEYEAKRDLRALRQKIGRARIQKLARTAVLLAVCTIIRTTIKRRATRVAKVPRPTNEQGHTEAPRSESTRSRAPPHHH